MPDQFAELDLAVRHLYQTFAAQPRRPELQTDFCTHCVSQQEADALVSTPVCDLQPAVLRVFVANAVSWTWGTPDDLWYCLPRVLELVAVGEFDRYDIAGLFTAMSAGWRDWPECQQEAITAYLTALWLAAIDAYWLPGKLDFLDLLKAAGDLDIPVDPYLRAWEAAGSEAAALQLAWLIRHGSSQWANPTADWSRTVGQWIRGPAPRRVLSAAAAAAASTPEAASNLSGALAILDSLSSGA